MGYILSQPGSSAVWLEVREGQEAGNRTVLFGCFIHRMLQGWCYCQKKRSGVGQGRGVAEQVGAEGGTSTAQSLDELIASFKKLVIGYKLTGEERKKKAK